MEVMKVIRVTSDGQEGNEAAGPFITSLTTFWKFSRSHLFCGTPESLFRASRRNE